MTELSTKQRLLNAAIDMINENGEASLRVDELLAKVGFTAPTLYHHFGNREGLIVAAQTERFVRTFYDDIPMLIHTIEQAKTREDLQTVIRLTVGLRDGGNRRTIRMQRLNALGAAYARPELAHQISIVHEDVVRRVAAALKPFQDSGVIQPNVNVEMFVAWYTSSVIGSGVLELEPNSLNAELWPDLMATAMDHLLFG